MVKYFYIASNIIDFTSTNSSGFIDKPNDGLYAPTDGSLDIQIKTSLIMAATQGDKALPLLLQTVEDSQDKNEPFYPLTLTVKIPVKEAEKVLDYTPATDSKFSPISKLKISKIEELKESDISSLEFNPIKLPALNTTLVDLLAHDNASNFEFKFSKPPALPHQLKNGLLTIPIEVEISGLGLSATATIVINLKTFRLESNRLYFYLNDNTDPKNTDPNKWLDLKIFAFIFEAKELSKTQEYASEENHHGYIDLEARELVLAPKPIPQNDSILRVAFPGGQSNSGEPNDRFYLKLKPLGKDATGPYLKLGVSGLSFWAELLPQQVLLPYQVEVQPVLERNGIRSEIKVINNTLVTATIFGTAPLPGFKNLTVLIEVALRREDRNKPPKVLAALHLEEPNQAAIGNLDLGFLKMRLDELRLALTWEERKDKDDKENWEWNFQAYADGEISFLPGSLKSLGGLDNLVDTSTIEVYELNLFQLKKLSAPKELSDLGLKLRKPIEFSILDGYLRCWLHDLVLRKDNNFIDLRCSQAGFAFRTEGALEVAIETGGLQVTIKTDGSQINMKLPSTLAITVQASSAVKFRGEVSWVDKYDERFFAAAGTVSIEGMSEVTAFLKLGTGRKASGRMVPNVAIYAAKDMDTQLFSGVVMKNIGAGIGINNQLAGIGLNPSADDILSNIDSLRPDQAKGWSFVEAEGFYLSIVASTILASNVGGNDILNAYVAWLIVSLDTDLKPIAAGKLWLASSVSFVRKGSNFNRPAIVGALVLAVRRKTISAVLESRPNPAIQVDETGQLKKIFSKGRIRLSFFLSPNAVDYYLEEVSYRDDFLGAQVLFAGSYRMAIFEGIALVKARLSIAGNIPPKTLSAGCGGFSYEGSIALSVEFGGILGRVGMMAYGMIDARVCFRVSAWIEIGFEKTINLGFRKVTIGFSKKFELGSSRIELGFSGGVAFNNKGKVGFRGKVSISVPICGYRLEISPSFAYNPDVIDEVRATVAAYESRLNRLKSRKAPSQSPPSPISAAGGGVGPSLSIASGTTVPSSIGGSGSTSAPSTSPGVTPTSLPIVPSSSSLSSPLSPAASNTENALSTSEELPASPNTATGNPPELETGEKWLCYWRKLPQSDRYILLLVPSLKTPWFVPRYGTDEKSKEIKFVDYVSRIELIWNGQSISTTEISVPRNDNGDEPLSYHPYLIESAADTSELNNAVIKVNSALSKPIFITDPRVESTSRAYWTYEDQFRLPSYALPYDFRSIREVEAEGKGDNFLDEILEYEKLQALAAQQRQYRSPDSDEVEKLLQIRSSLIRLMLEDFNSPDWESNDNSPPENLIFHQFIAELNDLPDNWQTQLRVNIHRSSAEVEGANGVGRTTLADLRFPDDPQEEQPFMAVVKRLPIRQKFVLDAEETAQVGQQIGKVLVKLPVKFELSNQDLQDFLPRLNYFRIYRQFPWEDKLTLIADFVRPQLTYYQQAQDEQDDKDQQYILISPYLYTDEFSVVTNALGQRVFTLPNLIAGQTEILYCLEAIPYGDPNPDEFEKERGLWASVRLHIPAPDLFPRSLAAVFAVEQLYWFEDKDTEFQLISRRTEQPELARLGDRLLQLQDFQIWAEEIAILQSGFYVGDEFETKEEPKKLVGSKFQTQDEEDGNSNQQTSRQVDLRTLKPDQLYQSTDGKFRLHIAEKNGHFYLSHEGLRTGVAYRFYIRPSDAPEDALLAPLNVFLVQQPDFWLDATKLRSVEYLEWIDKKAATGITLLSDRYFNVISFPKYERNHLRCFWELGNVTDGGVEITIRDQDDSTLVYRQVCEVMEEAVFRVSQRDFSNPSLWILTPKEIQLRAGFDGSSNTTTEMDQQYKKEYFLPVEFGIKKSVEELKSQLDNWDSWAELFPALDNWIDAIHQYQRSPKNRNDKSTQATIESILLAVKLFVVGYQDDLQQISELKDLNPEALLDKLKTWTKNLDQKLKDTTEQSYDAIEKSVDPKADQTTKFQDVTFSRKLAAILQSRLAYANDILGAVDLVPPKHATTEKLPYANQWNVLFKNWNELKIQNDKKSLFTQWFFDHIQDVTTSTSSSVLLECLNVLAKKLEDYAVLNDEIAKITPTATQLSNLLQDLEQEWQKDNFILIQRPHHQLVVEEEPQPSEEGQPLGQETTEAQADVSGKTKEPGRKRAVKTALEVFLPDSVGTRTVPQELLKLDPSEKLEVSPNTKEDLKSDELARSAVAYFNLLERLGFAVDFTVINNLNEIISQAEIVAFLDNLSKREPEKYKDCDIVLLVGREPDSEYQSEAVGFSFVKLAVVPKAFHQLMTSITNTTIDEEKWKAVKAWYENRSITLDKEEDVAKAHLQHIGKIAQYIWYTFGQNQKNYQIVQVELRTSQWLTVPAVAGRCHSLWTAPDLKGHRFRVALRRISRYEPLIRWAKRETRPIEIPPPDRESKTPNWVEVNVLRHILAPQSGKPQEGPADLEVLQYPHPSKIQFTYSLPAEGARSLYNNISAIRTGYKGTDLTFEYKVIDRDDATLAQRVEAIKSDESENSNTELLPPDDLLKQQEESTIRLFRHERLVTLNDLPYFYEYRLQVRSLYQISESWKQQKQQPVEEQQSDRFVRRKPSQIAVFRPQIKKVKGNYEVTIFLTRNQDNLTAAEVAASPPHLNFLKSDNSAGLPVNDLPDFGMGYQLLYQVKERTTNSSRDDGNDGLYILLAEVLLPWRMGYEPQSNPKSSPPFVRKVNSNVMIQEDEGSPPSDKLWRPINKSKQSGTFAIRFTLVDENDHFSELSKYYLQASFDDALSTARPFQTID